MNTMMMAVILLLILLGLLFLNVPVAFCIATAATVVCLISGIDLIRMPQTMFTGMNSFTLLAIPYFLYAGALMEHGGISQRLVDFAYSLVAHLRGGLAHVTILACMFFAAISGSSIATTAAIGRIMVPDMQKKGYDPAFTGAVAASGGITGVIIPPSMTMVLFGAATGTSIGAMFMAGIIPGILIGCSLMIIAYIFSKKYGYPVGEKSSIKEKLDKFKKAILALMMPVIILGGIYGGIFTPTEAATVACVYGMFIAIVVYRFVDFKKFRMITRSAVKSTCTIGIILGVAMYFGNWLTVERIPHLLSETIGNAGWTLYFTLLIINVLLLALGCFMDTGAALIICAPILTPIVVTMGMHPVHFGIIMVVNLAIGNITPPVGILMYVAADIAKVPFSKIVKPILAFCLMAIADLFLISYLSPLVLGLPKILGLIS